MSKKFDYYLTDPGMSAEDITSDDMESLDVLTFCHYSLQAATNALLNEMCKSVSKQEGRVSAEDISTVYRMKNKLDDMVL